MALGLSDFIIHRKEADLLREMFTVDNVPHILVSGPPHCGKKTMMRAWMAHIFGSDKPSPLLIGDYCLKIHNNTVDMEYLYNQYCYEFNLFEYGLYDRGVITEYIQQFIELQTINQQLRFIVLNHFEQISKDAQYALRNVIESCSSSFRFILIVDELSQIDKILFSRFYHFSMRTPRPEDIQAFLSYHNVPTDICPSLIERATDRKQFNVFVLDTLVHFYKVCGKVLPIKQIDQTLVPLFKSIEEPSLDSMKACRDKCYQLLLLNVTMKDLYRILIERYLGPSSPIPDSKKTDFIAKAAFIQSKMSRIEFDVIGVEYLILFIKHLMIRRKS